ncbi:MAG: RluA family pseudouridine synthase [Spiroplasma sp.]
MESKIKKYSFHYHLEQEIRLDKFLAQVLHDQGYSRTFISNLIAQKQVKVNDIVVTSSKKLLKQNDEVIIFISYADSQRMVNDLVAKQIEIPIVYEDDDLIIVDKPNNLVVHPGAGNFDNTLVNGLLFNMKNLSSIDETRPGIVHRLDKQTTGLLIVAKNNQSHYFLSQELKNHQIKREYIALVHGRINSRSGTIDAPIARDRHSRLKMTVSEINARNAVTHFKVLERFDQYTLIGCQLETGRTHQIRVHLQWINHPVVNDPLYSKYSIEDSNFGQYLHAYKITFIHPKTKKIMIFKSDLPEFFENRVQLLRKERGN